MKLNYEETLLDLARGDDRIVVLTSENRAAIRNLPAELGDRFIDFGITEQTMVGAAAGLALRGRVPVVHALATFLTMRAFEFVRTDVGLGALPVKLVGGVPGFLSEANGPTHQAIEDISLMRGIPGMEIFCPADAEELTLGMRALISRPNPCYVRYNAAAPAVEHIKPFSFEKAEVLREGSDVTIVSFGILLKETLKAADILEGEGRRVRLVNLHTLKPVDEATILKSAINTDILVTVEDHLQSGGLYSIICDLLAGHYVRCPVFPIALRERWFKPAMLPDVLDYEGFTGKRIAERIVDALDGLDPYLIVKGNRWQIL